MNPLGNDDTYTHSPHYKQTSVGIISETPTHVSPFSSSSSSSSSVSNGFHDSLNPMTFSAWPCSRASFHRRRHANSPRRRHKEAPSTPLLRWKLDDAGNAASSPAANSSGGARLSSRKLAAGLWQLRFNEIAVADGRDSLYAVPCDRLPPELKPSLSYPNRVMEKKTKGGRGRSKESDDVRYVFKHQKLPAEKRGPSVSVVSALQAELLQARCRIRELEANKQSLRKKVKTLLNKLENERISWQRRERLKNYAATNELKDELVRERKIRRRMEVLNVKLANQLANVKLSAEQLMQGFEEEKKSGELMEGVCDKLVKQIGENKGEIERLNEEYVKVREELEEERKMLQLAEVWREERVQMKLVDAKLALEDKYSKMNMLITDLETLLGSANFPLDAVELQKAENILQAAAESLSIQDIFEEFSYVPPESNDLFSILKELQECEINGREIEPRSSHSRDDDFEMASPEFGGFKKNHNLMHSNCLTDYKSVLEDDARVCDAVCRAEYQSSNHSLEGCNSSLEKLNQMKNVLRNRIECDEDADQRSPSIQVSEVSVSTKKLQQKNVSVASKDHRPKPSVGIYKTVTNQGDKRLPNGTISCPETTSPEGPLGEGEPRRRGQWISAGLANPHITRGMKGCIEWPRAIQKNVLKAKVSEAMIESQKSQLRHILKPKT